IEARRDWSGRGWLVGMAATAGIGLLTAQILVLHSMGGRSTSLAAAGAWAMAAVGVWAVLAFPGLAVAERMASAGYRAIGLVLRLLGLVAVLVAAAITLRASVDPLLPAGASRDLPFLEL